MKKVYFGTGIFCLVILIGLSIFFILKYDEARKLEIPAKKVRLAPLLYNHFDIIKSKNYTSQQELLIDLLKYQNYTTGYTRDYIECTYNNLIEETKYQLALMERSNRARSYLLYMAVLDSDFAFLALLSFLMASRVKEEVAPCSN